MSVAVLVLTLVALLLAIVTAGYAAKLPNDPRVTWNTVLGAAGLTTIVVIALVVCAIILVATT